MTTHQIDGAGDDLRLSVRLLAPDLLRVDLVGALDHSTAGRLLDAWQALLAEHCPARLHVNLAGVTFIDSSGLGALVAGWKAVQPSGCELTLVEVGDTLRAKLDLTGIDQLMRVEAGAAE